jgi:hypothetical protein
LSSRCRRLALARAAVVSGSAGRARRSAIGTATATATGGRARADVVAVESEAKAGAAVGPLRAGCAFISAGAAVAAARFGGRCTNRGRARNRDAIERAASVAGGANRADIETSRRATAGADAFVVLAKSAATVAILGARAGCVGALRCACRRFVLAECAVAFELTVGGAAVRVVHAAGTVCGARTCRRRARAGAARERNEAGSCDQQKPSKPAGFAHAAESAPKRLGSLGASAKIYERPFIPQ